MHDIQGREQKARTMVAVLEDYLPLPLHELSLLDVGASTGIIDHYLAGYFRRVAGIDIDYQAVQHAHETYRKQNLHFSLADALSLPFSNACFHVVICSHVYEHVPDSGKMLAEIFRVLEPGGICYLAAGNRIMFKEPHYNLPFLSVLPHSLAHIYLRLTGKGTHYYEKHLSYWGLKSLSKSFRRIDYTHKVVLEPGKYYTDYMVPEGSWKSKVARFVLKYAYWMSPGYIWLLQKPDDRNAEP
jgi:2-polyprenyl-3-methyl-5-hydroxy-6-metoxy-1,4-benzoquinol methylase